jgi:hypothetical protein
MEILLVLALCVITLCIAGVVFIAFLKKSQKPPQPSPPPPRVDVRPSERYEPPFERYARQLAAVTRPG